MAVLQQFAILSLAAVLGHADLFEPTIARSLAQRASASPAGEMSLRGNASLDNTTENKTNSSSSGASTLLGASKPKVFPIQAFNDQLDATSFQGEGLYYEFATSTGETVWSGQVEGRHFSFSNATTLFPMASASKLFTAFATMMTMELKKKDWYPKKYIHEFKGWEEFKNFPISKTNKTANLTVHHLLTHTSGLPFGMRMSKKDISKLSLAYEPGTAFGYTLGHRVVGWMLRDYWMVQKETKSVKIKTVQDTFKWLYFDKMGLKNTAFDDTMKTMFGASGQAGDASISSTGEDFVKLAVTALNRGTTAEGVKLISEDNWKKWAVPNLLPGGKLSKDLVGWQGQLENSWTNWDVGNVKEKIMQQSGDYGWNYFGATYYNSKEIGWCGFFSSCLRVTYENGVAFVMMQRDISDMKKSKPYLVEHYAEMTKSLRCAGLDCSDRKSSTVHCQINGKVAKKGAKCITSSKRTKNILFADDVVDPSNHSCFAPTCEKGWFPWR